MNADEFQDGSSKLCYRFALFSTCELGAGGLAFRVKRALERLGHTAFLFTPHMYGEIYHAGVVDFSQLGVFFERQRIACAFVFDGLEIRGAHEASTLPMIARFDNGRVPFTSKDAGAGLSIMVDGAAGNCESLTFLLTHLVDYGLNQMVLANGVIETPAYVCVQDATPSRVRFFEKLLEGEPSLEGRISCFGRGWDGRFASSDGYADFVYAVRGASAVVAFCDGEDQDGFLDARIAPSASIGCPLVCVGGKPSGSFASSMIDASCWDSEGIAVISRIAKESHSSVESDAVDACLESDMAVFLERISSVRPFPEKLAYAGRRTAVMVVGYLGMANFGDELILSEVERWFARTSPETVVYAVSENPWHTLTVRGVFALKVGNKFVLGEALRDSSAMMVLAGLLFDQGSRWTMGEASLLTLRTHTDIPCLTGLVSLASMLSVPSFFISCGAGPLDLRSSRRMVKLMGSLGAVFLTRDRETSSLLESCGVPESQIGDYADVIYAIGSDGGQKCREWLERNGRHAEGSNLFVVSLREYEGMGASFTHDIAASLDRLNDAHPNIAFVFCALDPSDVGILTRVRDEMRHASNVLFYDNANDIDTLCSLMELAYAGLCMRLHANIVMNRFGHPTVGVDYLPKVRSIFEDSHMESLLISTNSDETEIFGCLSDLLSNSEEFEQLVVEYAEQAKLKALEALNAVGVASGRTAALNDGCFPQELYPYDCPSFECPVEWADRFYAAERARVSAAEGLAAERLRLLDAANDELRAIRESRSFRLAHFFASVYDSVLRGVGLRE